MKPNNGEALQDLTDELRGCIEMLRAMDRLNEIDTRTSMVDTVH